MCTHACKHVYTRSVTCVHMPYHRVYTCPTACVHTIFCMCTHACQHVSRAIRACVHSNFGHVYTTNLHVYTCKICMCTHAILHVHRACVDAGYPHMLKSMCTHAWLLHVYTCMRCTHAEMHVYTCILACVQDNFRCDERGTQTKTKTNRPRRKIRSRIKHLNPNSLLVNTVKPKRESVSCVWMMVWDIGPIKEPVTR